MQICKNFLHRTHRIHGTETPDQRLRDHVLSPPCDAVSMATTVSWVTPVNITMTSSPVVRATLQMVHKT